MSIKSLSCLLYVKSLFIVDSVTVSAFVLCTYIFCFLSAQILMNVKIQTPASMSVKIPLGAIGVSVHLAMQVITVRQTSMSVPATPVSTGVTVRTKSTDSSVCVPLVSLETSVR